MKRFSERKGLKKVRTEIQVNSIDEALTNSLWNVLDYHYWRRCSLEYDEITSEMRSFLNKLWHNYFKEPVDTISESDSWQEALENIRERYFDSAWFEVYDFLEFVADNFPDEDANQRFMKTCNDVLEKELSAYRFVGGLITQVTSETEISTIEKSLESPFKTVNAHLENALKLMSDRKSPDYRNSIKESISAVEAICRVIAQDDKATLGKALDKIEKKIGLHGALKRAFDSLYGYTSSAEGIRHAILEEGISLGFEDAKFMLVSCSAFINYLNSKASKAGIVIEK